MNDNLAEAHDSNLEPQTTAISTLRSNLEEKSVSFYETLNPQKFYDQLDQFLTAADRADTVDYYVLVRRFHDAIDDRLSEMKKVITHMEENILPDILKDEDEFGMTTGFRTEKSPRLGYTVYVGTENYVSLPDKEAAFSFLRECQYGDAIEETVHHKRLPSIYREINEKGIDIPEGLFKVSTKHKARLRNS